VNESAVYKVRDVVLGLGAVCALQLAAASVATASFPYPSTPFPLGARPTALTAYGGELWAGRQGTVLVLTPQPDGSLRRTRELKLDAAAQPTAVVPVNDRAFVLDAATSSVLVFAIPDESTPRLIATLPVGPQPSALAAGRILAGPWYVAVANAGSGDVSIYTADGDGPFSTAGRVPVGTEPRAIVAGHFTDDYEDDLAVANAGSGTVTILAGDGAGGLRRHADIAVGGSPSALAIGYDDYFALDFLVAGPAEGQRLVVLRQGANGLRRGSTLALPTLRGPVSLALLASGDEGQLDSLVVADRASGTVSVLPGRTRGRFGPPSMVRSGVDPVGVVAGGFGGDFQSDLAVADAQSETVSLLLTPGDRLVSLVAGAESVAARAGRIVWSREAAWRDHRLVAWRDEAAGDLPIASSERRLTPRLGRRSPRDPVASYVRCRRHRCRAFAWHFRVERERRLRLAIPHKCEVGQVAVWDRISAYTVKGRQCPPASSGLWLRRGQRRARRLDPTARLGDLRGRKLTWFDVGQGGDRWKIRVKTLGRRARTISGGTFDCCNEGVPRLSNGAVYWTIAGLDGELTLPLIRAPAPVPPCRRSRHEWGSFDGVPGIDEYQADFAVDGRRIYYADYLGVWQVDPARLRWRCLG